MKLLKDPNNRVKFFAAYGLGKLGDKSAVAPLIEMLRANNDEDLYLRQAGVVALTWIGDKAALITAAKDTAKSVRLASLLVMRRLEMPEVALFLNDKEATLALESIRAINDVPIAPAMPKLAALIKQPAQEEPVALRVVNANYRVGGAENAKALATAAADKNALTVTRTEALGALARWANPPARDRVMGLYRPLPARDEKPAVAALQTVIGDILKTAPEDIRLAGIEAVTSLKLKEVSPILADLVKDTTLAAKVRVEALKSLEALGYEKLEAVVQVAIADKAEIVRKEGNRLESKFVKDVAAQLAGILEKGSIVEKQGAMNSLATVKGEKADQLLAKWLDNLIAGKAPNEVRWDIVAAAQGRDAKNVKEKLAKYEASFKAGDNLAKYRELQWGGNAESGKKIFYEKVEASCLRCHQIKKEGGEVGPPLDGIASKVNREYLLEAIVDPSAKIAPGYETLLISKKDGGSVAGIFKGETADELTLLVQEEGGTQLVKIKKADIKNREKGLSGMVAGLGEILPKQDIRDIIEFLNTLK